MTSPSQGEQLQLRSLIRRSGELELSLVQVPIPRPEPGEVLLRIEATPLNPSDHGVLFGAADMSVAVASGTPDRPIITAPVSASAMKAMAGRLDQSLPVGIEGAGTVIETGDSDAARALLGKKVAVMSGAMYSQFRSIPADQCLVLPDDMDITLGASAFVNPMTAFGMIETMRREDHRAIVHTAAASNLGQMLQRLCASENIPLVNIVRTAQQETLLRELGAVHVCNTSSTHFFTALTEAIGATGATLAFDAIGGGPLASQILKSMEVAASKSVKTYSRYGSTVHKQVYLYGSLDLRPTELLRDYGMAWGLGGWLVLNFMQEVGPIIVTKMKQRVAAELDTTFLSKYSREISLAETLQLDVMTAYRKRETGQKYLIRPNSPQN